MPLIRAALATFAALTMLSSAALADDWDPDTTPMQRAFVWVNAGAAVGVFDISCNFECDQETRTSSAFVVQAGGTIQVDRLGESVTAGFAADASAGLGSTNFYPIDLDGELNFTAGPLNFMAGVGFAVVFNPVQTGLGVNAFAMAVYPLPGLPHLGLDLKLQAAILLNNNSLNLYAATGGITWAF